MKAPVHVTGVVTQEEYLMQRDKAKTKPFTLKPESRQSRLRPIGDLGVV
jgi:hypothetical protein